jgi:hypothetical protein
MRGAAIALGLVILSLGTTARAQNIWLAPGSTAQGDYLRGLGVAAIGMGFFEVADATAFSMNTDTLMRIDLYIGACAAYEAKMHSARLKADAAREKEYWNKIRQRLKENPESLDVDRGDALNVLLEELNGGKFQDSAQREIKVPLPVELVRRIPFKLGEKGVKSFSMEKLMAKGRSNWPVAFQDEQFARQRRAYEKARERALDQQVAGKVEKSSIDLLEATVNDLQVKLDEVYLPTDKRYIDAMERMRQLHETVEMLRWTKIQLALAELDQYPGQTVNDLRIFMHRHNLQFSSGTTPDERELLPQILEKLKMHRIKMQDGPDETPK